METLSTVMTGTRIPVPDHLPDFEIPVLSGVQAQGDLLIQPAGPRPGTTWSKVVPEGFEVVRGEQAGNTHLLIGDCSVSGVTDGLVVCLVEVHSEAFLIHPEHGANGIAAGVYEIRRQREMTAAGWRQVTD